MDYIAKDNVVAAHETDDRIVKAVENLMMFPLMGRIGRVSGTRELVVAQSDFIVAYKLTEEVDNITVLRVLHGAQQ